MRFSVPWYRSVNTKIFVIIVLCLSALTSVATYRHAKKLFVMLEREHTSHALRRADSASQNLDATIAAYAGQMSSLMHGQTNVSLLKSQRSVSDFVKSNSQFLGFTIIETDNLKKRSRHVLGVHRNGEAFKGLTLSKTITRAAHKWMRMSKNKPHGIYLNGASHYRGRPLVQVVIPFKVPKKKQIYWAFLTLDSSRLAQGLVSSINSQAILLSNSGETILSSGSSGVLNGSSNKTNLLKAVYHVARKSGGEWGIRSASTDGGLHVAAFVKLPKYRAIMVVGSDASATVAEVRRQVLESVLFTMIFGMIAILVGYVTVRRMVTWRIERLADVALHIAAGNFSTRVNNPSQDEIGLLGRTVNYMAERIVSLMRSMLETGRMEQEMKTAKAVQTTFLPRTGHLSNSHIAISSYFRPSSECAGDWWWHKELDDGCQVFVIADATGHGVSAALITAMAYAMFQSAVTQSKLRDPGEIIEHVNAVLSRAGDGGVCTLTCFVAVYDPKNGDLVYSNAGHHHPYLLQLGGDVTDGRKVRFVPGAGNIVGFMTDSTFKTQRIKVKNGERLLLYTDGLVECNGQDGKPFQKKKLIRSVTEELGLLDNRSAMARMSTIVNEFFDGTSPDDDITVLIVDFFPPSKMEAVS